MSARTPRGAESLKPVDAVAEGRSAEGARARGSREPAPVPEAVGSIFLSARKAQQLSQDQVAALTRGRRGQLSRAMISMIERGRHLPGLEALVSLSKALYLDPAVVLEQVELADSDAGELDGVSHAELERRAGDSFWAGNYREAVSIYDAMLRRAELEPAADGAERNRVCATIELRRAAALRRLRALTAARAGAERAVCLADGIPELQAEAYVVLVALHAELGHLPLAKDAADRAVELAENGGPRVRGWAWIEKGTVLYRFRRFAEARQAFVRARRFVRQAADQNHEIHVEGNIAMCLRELGKRPLARARLVRAVELARRYVVPAKEALWLVELGRLALDEGDVDGADRYADAALRIAKPREHLLTIFCAEWVRHLAVRRRDPRHDDRHRLAYLRRLFLRLGDHHGVDELREFKERVIAPGQAERSK